MKPREPKPARLTYYQKVLPETHKNKPCVCLIKTFAHGTPASIADSILPASQSFADTVLRTRKAYL